MKIVIRTLEGLESVLSKEAEKLHLSDIQIIRRGITCQGNWAQLYKANYLLRTAIRILVPIKECTITTQQDYYDAIRAMDWTSYFRGRKTTFAVQAVIVSDIFTNSHFAALRCKDAIVDSYLAHKGHRPNVSVSNPDMLIQVYLSGDQLSVSLDSSGKSLHLRGYKERSFKAPLNEALAAGILGMSDWNGQKTFCDPMCGSGTFTTEALMMATHTPAGHFRANYAFEKWADYHHEIWKTVKGNADAAISEPEADLHASDLNSFAVRDLKKNLQKFKYRKSVSISQADFLASAGKADSIVMLNPPYDERIKLYNVVSFYRSIGDKLKTDWSSSEAWVISSHTQAMKNFGLKTSVKHDLDNGGLKARLYKFDLYEGSLKNQDNNSTRTGD